ncbi:MAG TPA: hypothetical protein VK249_23780 [Anaerolineales bacterium]|nr:hypothetical protein [Anaerolineales bacterium]
MMDKYTLLENYLRALPTSEEEVTLTFEGIEQILHEPLPDSAREDYAWWSNQKPGIQIETNPWMDAGWMVETVDLNEKWVRLLRQ